MVKRFAFIVFGTLLAACYSTPPARDPWIVFGASESVEIDTTYLPNLWYNGRLIMADTTVYDTTITTRLVSVALFDPSRGLYQEVTMPRTSLPLRVVIRSWLKHSLGG